MSKERAPYRTANHLLKNARDPATMDAAIPVHEVIQVSRKELEQEHIHLMARIQQLRRLLGFPPLATGSQLRRQHE